MTALAATGPNFAQPDGFKRPDPRRQVSFIKKTARNVNGKGMQGDGVFGLKNRAHNARP
jgi:hypothetical protein